MNSAHIRPLSLVLAAGAMTLAAPAAAFPTIPAQGWERHTPVHGVTTAGYDDDDDDDRDDRGRHRGWHKRDRYERYDRYDRYRSSHRPRAYYERYPANYGEPVYNNTRVWRGDDGRYYCRKSDGTTGLLIGGAVGALLGREIAGRSGDRTLGAILGAAGGALLGKSIDSKSRCR